MIEEHFEDITLINGDCIKLMRDINDESINCILTDPPYKYLKNQKLEVDFDETEFLKQAKRVLKPNGFIVLFGRGTSFYRWNTMLADLGFIFKEEIVWDKGHCTSPLMNISRVHETISIYAKKSGIIKKVKVPYMEMKRHNIDSIIQDIKRLRSIFSDVKSMNAVMSFLENNIRDKSEVCNGNNLSISSDITKEDRCVSIVRSLSAGLNEKTIIRTDRSSCATFTKHNVNSDMRKSGNRAANTVQSIEFGLNEKTIIKQVRDHYSSIHPTQKPVRLLERLLALTTNEGDTVLDPFFGSGSCGEACINKKLKFIGFEIDEEYYKDGSNRIMNAKEAKENKIKIESQQQNLF
jgi:site-specific DNA-methyltransferase (adenine-specific)